jgi:hypothetical protein
MRQFLIVTMHDNQACCLQDQNMINVYGSRRPVWTKYNNTKVFTFSFIFRNFS